MDGFKGSSSGLQEEQHSGAARNGTDREGGKESIMPGGGGDGTPTATGTVSARRSADYGGSSESAFQSAIGGPFMGRSGNSESKAKQIAGLPA